MYEMPVGTDLEFVEDATGKYVVNTRTGEKIRERVKSGILPGNYPVILAVMDSLVAGLVCFCDEKAAESYWRFIDKWYGQNPKGNLYDDYFCRLFAKSYRQNPQYQRPEGDFLLWENPEDGTQIVMFASGLGDGYYSPYWGMDEDGRICELVVVFMDPELF